MGKKRSEINSPNDPTCQGIEFNLSAKMKVSKEWEFFDFLFQ
ncbi:hypothetical protein [Vibrio sp. 16]|nr:hypothetical protein [Vibrio sp. 16]EED25401.1 hypothetical protein VPMS16_2771 [Vibrio sp. 16]CAK4076543.1 hypothetical protein PVDT1_27 [Vibrio sp. 16]